VTTSDIAHEVLERLRHPGAGRITQPRQDVLAGPAGVEAAPDRVLAEAVHRGAAARLDVGHEPQEGRERAGHRTRGDGGQVSLEQHGIDRRGQVRVDRLGEGLDVTVAGEQGPAADAEGTVAGHTKPRGFAQHGVDHGVEGAGHPARAAPAHGFGNVGCSGRDALGSPGKQVEDAAAQGTDRWPLAVGPQGVDDGGSLGAAAHPVR